METMVFTDKSVEPNNELIFSCLNGKKVYWEQLMSDLAKEYNDFVGEWKYYKDGGSWLFRGMIKGKVVFWTAVFPDNFNVTFYLSSKAEPMIMESDIPEALKEKYESTRDIKFRYISILVNSEEDIESVKKLFKIKLKVK